MEHQILEDKSISLDDKSDSMVVENFENIVEVFIEISKGSNIKYEFDKEKKYLVCDRILYTPFRYIFNYGFIPNTLSLDSDPIDAVVLVDESLVPGCYIKCKIIGCLETSDAEGIDPKLILCPIDKIDPKSKNINQITDLPTMLLEQIKYFFSHYKDLENKQVQIGNFVSREQSIQIYLDSVENYKTQHTK
jgi:inorganic pyrophosphatase